MTERRAVARMLATEAVDRGEPLAWFEELYAASRDEGAVVPWADLEVNPNLSSWDFDAIPADARVLVVGCGLGDDAEWLSAKGYDVTAFDISASAVQRCRERFPHSDVRYLAADLLDLPAAWAAEPFDLVVEIYTIQVLPPGSPVRERSFGALAAVTGGTLLVIARLRGEDDDPGAMPWPLTLAELDAFAAHGLDRVDVADFLDGEDPPVRRLVASFRSR